MSLAYGQGGPVRRSLQINATANIAYVTHSQSPALSLLPLDLQHPIITQNPHTAIGRSNDLGAVHSYLF